MVRLRPRALQLAGPPPLQELLQRPVDPPRDQALVAEEAVQYWAPSGKPRSSW